MARSVATLSDRTLRWLIRLAEQVATAPPDSSRVQSAISAVAVQGDAQIPPTAWPVHAPAESRSARSMSWISRSWTTERPPADTMYGIFHFLCRS